MRDYQHLKLDYPINRNASQRYSPVKSDSDHSSTPVREAKKSRIIDTPGEELEKRKKMIELFHKKNEYGNKMQMERKNVRVKT